jgi:hypothetical protein
MPTKPITRPVTITPAMSAASYTTGQTIGGANKVSLSSPNGEGAVLAAMILTDVDNQNCAIDAFFFSTQPTVADKSTFAPTAAQVKTCLGKASVLGANYISVGAAGSIVQTADQEVALPGTFWVVLVARGSATYTTTSSLTLQVGLKADS